MKLPRCRRCCKHAFPALGWPRFCQLPAPCTRPLACTVNTQSLHAPSCRRPQRVTAPVCPPPPQQQQQPQPPLASVTNKQHLHIHVFAPSADDGTEAGLGLLSPGLAKNVVAMGAGYKTNDNGVLQDVLTVRGADGGGREIFSLTVSARPALRGLFTLGFMWQRSGVRVAASRGCLGCDLGLCGGCKLACLYSASFATNCHQLLPTVTNCHQLPAALRR